MDEIEKLREELANVRQSALQFDEERDRLRDKLVEVRAELAEANARREDLRTALEWSNAERDRLRERCETLANNHEWRVEELAARRKERDEARARVESLKQDLANMEKMHAEQCRHGVSLERRLLESRADLHKTNEVLDAIAKALDLDHDDDIQDAVADMVAELERAEESIEDLRAEVATAAKYCDELAETIRMHVAREIELEAEVERLRNAFRRGAEAMREACAQRVEGEGNGHYGLTGADVAKTLRALPIPEER